MNYKVVLNIEEELKTFSSQTVAMKLFWADTPKNLRTNVLIQNSFERKICKEQELLLVLT